MSFHKRRDPRITDELRFHRDRLIEHYIAAGLERREAERRAFLEFGNVAQIEEAVYDVRGRWLDDLANDVRHSWRTIRRSPGFAVAAVMLFALGIGANAAIFGLINTVMLRALPVPETDRLVQITRIMPDGTPGAISYPLFELLRDRVHAISGAFGYVAQTVPVVIGGVDDYLAADFVSGAYFAVLELQPAAGRLLIPADDDAPTASPAAVISDSYWQRRFGRSPSAVGTAILIRDRAFTIVGVTPRSFQSARAGRIADLMVPLRAMIPEPQRRNTDLNFLNLLARLKPGATIDAADAEAQVLFSGFVQSQAATAREKDRAGILRQRIAAFASPDGFNPMRGAVGQPLWILMGTVGLILLLACVNISGLLVARAAARQREISIRLAIGAGRGRLVRQFLSESLLLASIGGAVGLAIAVWLSGRLLNLFVNGRDIVLSTTPDWHVLAFTVIVSVAACCIAGLLPALQAIRVNINPALKQLRASGHHRLGKALVIAQLAISMIVIIGATLFVGTLVQLSRVETGFDPDGLVVVALRSSSPFPASRTRTVQSAVRQELATLPEVTVVSAVLVPPVSGILFDRTVQVEGYAFSTEESEKVGFNAVSPKYFAALGTPLLAGREFEERDNERASKVAIVNATFARYFFSDGESALGRHITSANETYEIVGVVGDTKYQNLREPAMKTMYIPWLQRDGEQPTNCNYLVRASTSDPLRLTPALDRVVRRADPALRVRNVSPYSAFIERSISIERIMATLGGLFGLLALTIAAVGVFGLLAFQVARRTSELGVRLALGASRVSMIRLILADVIAMLVPGIAIGVGLALAVADLARKIVFGLTPTDPTVFVVAAATLAGAVLFAAWLPARRALRVDPVAALRSE